jgi:3-methylcrotonyl-CoA carboxylase alpha subunit
LHGTSRRHFDIQHGGEHHAVALERQRDGTLAMHIGTQRWPLLARALGDARHDITLGTRRMTLTVHVHGTRVAVFAPEGSAVLQRVDPLELAGANAAEGGRLTAPMPGKVIALLAVVGQSVQRGQALAVMEAMKMEHTLSAPRDGVVAEVLYAVGDQVAEGGELLKLAV